MDNVIQKMLGVEDQARQLVAQAETEAHAAIAAAQAAAKQQRLETLEAARTEARQLVEKTVSAAQVEKQRLLEERRAIFSNGLHLDDEKIRQTAAEIARRCRS